MIDTLVFDLETTGIDANTDRIVTAFVGMLATDGTLTHSQEWIVDPGVDIPTGASDVHGWTKERLDAYDQTRHDLDAVANEIAQLIWHVCGNTDIPVAGHNVSYDFTMLNAHLRRAGTPPLPFGANAVKVLDSIVLDKHFNRYVKGSGQRKLTPTAARYGIELTEEQAHDASFDAMAAGRISQAIIRKYVPHLTNSPDRAESLTQLHYLQAGWRAEQQTDLQKWLRTKGNEPTAICETAWPDYGTTTTTEGAKA